MVAALVMSQECLRSGSGATHFLASAQGVRPPDAGVLAGPRQVMKSPGQRPR
jgi:hypothetical protein